MTTFLAELGTKVADKWLNLLVLPGLLWVAVLSAGVRLGQEHVADVSRLRAWLDQVAAHRASHDPATVLLVSAAILLASAAAGLAAAALGSLLQWLWVLPGDLPPAAWLLTLRQWRWDQATARLKARIADAARPGAQQADRSIAARRVRRAQDRRARLGASRPLRPTWVGERFLSAATRIRERNGLDIDVAWPRLWAVLPGHMRGDLARAQDAYTAAGRLAAWGVLYLAVAVAWWPAALVGLAVLGTAAVRSRGSAGVLAELVESAADLYTKDLSTALGLPPAPDAAAMGRAVSARLLAVPASSRPQDGEVR